LGSGLARFLFFGSDFGGGRLAGLGREARAEKVEKDAKWKSGRRNETWVALLLFAARMQARVQAKMPVFFSREDDAARGGQGVCEGQSAGERGGKLGKANLADFGKFAGISRKRQHFTEIMNVFSKKFQEESDFFVRTRNG
jgi:hypothetical protein